MVPTPYCNYAHGTGVPQVHMHTLTGTHRPRGSGPPHGIRTGIAWGAFKLTRVKFHPQHQQC